MNKEIEEWRPVVGYEGLYEVSDWGNVRSTEKMVVVYGKLSNTFPGTVVDSKTIEPKIKSKHHDKDGYEGVNLKHKGIHTTKKVHRLVAEAFIENPENKPIVDHINGKRDDNRASNLRWCTQSQNLNTTLARSNISASARVSASRRSRNNLGQFAP